MSNSLRDPDEYYRWPHPPVGRSKLGIVLQSSVFAEVGRFDYASTPEYRGDRMGRRRWNSESFQSLLTILMRAYDNQQWQSIEDITEAMRLMPTSDYKERMEDLKTMRSFEWCVKFSMMCFLNDAGPETIHEGRWQYALDLAVVNNKVPYSPYAIQDISPLISGKALLTNAGYVICKVASDYGSGVRVNLPSPNTPQNFTPRLA